MSGGSESAPRGDAVRLEGSDASSPPVPVPPQDRFFLLFEGDGPPVSCLWCFSLRGESIDPERLREAAAEALARHPRARSRLRVEGRGARLYWEPGPALVDDICRFHPAEDYPGDGETLAARVAELQNRPFDLERGPIVELEAYRAKEENQDGILTFRFHHAIADGAGSLVFLQDLFRGPDGGDAGRDPTTSRGARAAASPRKLLGQLAGFLWRAGRYTRFAIPDHVYSGRKAPSGKFACAIRALAAGRERALAEAARRLGVHINDLLVASCARAIAALKEERSERCGTLRIMINRRFRRNATSFAIHSSAFPVWVRPQDRSDPVALARSIRRQVRDAVRQRVDEAIHLLGGLLSLPPPIPRLLVSSAKRRVGSDSFIVSNMGRLPELTFGPGAARVVRAFAFVRPPNGVGMVFAVAATEETTTLALSYLTDALRSVEAQRLLELIEMELASFDTAGGGPVSC